MLAIQKEVKNNQSDNSHQDYLMKLLQRLENNTIETSLSAINELERLAQDNPQFHWIIMDMLTNFVREKTANLPPEEVISDSLVDKRILIQSAMIVIGKRDVKQDPENEQIDLSYTDLRGLNLQGINLAHTNLYQVNLSQANLVGANLEGAILSAANLAGANLTNANLHRANLYLASLKDAILDDAILEGANLREAKFTI
ncbi:MAG: pentapeptide repeat-containing protein [Sphaerospermopsis kisseleviana]|uniref:Pentapeptide repeat-containing protein n=4 Tax=Aphanizomenonaceae TaxID=1892259 RepID=A0A479ZRX1_9CYAN|nr:MULTISPECIES: pentapeptide repeat-containing protein [Sphaerospermopsis]MBD2131291.1 pentapeptide repeat-containing protein [Sphaerospermopsis sp. FACHB-1094]BAZ83395.1 pentapeptide repeat-containing protein [Sphaerospermopsis kisseleviana NIES-73]GCL35237.1 pentapeptide repeat-containing protein [Sphaerospermopsis reniformis]MBD2145654.1 pentapeptide repeat-containing protein [Sphaerospermopsis sp. FACHB-1194]MDB9442127.1 pentapeptide repeat-containing protein [Sphaerospermopsis kisselevia